MCSKSVRVKSSFADKVMVIAQLRDVIHETLFLADRKSLSNRNTRCYEQWLEENGMEDPSIQHIALRSHCETISSGPIRQVFHHLMYLKPFSQSGKEEDDKRPWQLYQHLKLSEPQLTCTFFQSQGSEKQTQKSKSAWHCGGASSFERALFLMYQGKMTGYRSSRTEQSSGSSSTEHGGKKRRLMSKGMHYRRNRDCAQRIAFVVHTIVAAWNGLAKSLGFRSMEEMALAYLIFDWEDVRFRCLRRKSDGYGPRKLAFSLDCSGEATRETSETFEGAAEREDVADKALRVLTASFLADLEELGIVEDLFDPKYTEWKLMDMFRVPPEIGEVKYASRFNDLKAYITALEETAVFRQEALAELGIEGSKTILTREGGRLKGMCRDDCSCASSRVTLCQFMNLYSRIYNVSFSDLSENDSMLRPVHEEDILGNVNLILTDPPYNIRRMRGRRNATYDVLLPDQMQMVVDHATELLCPGGHIVCFCSTEQFPQWVRLFSNKVVAEPGNISREVPAFRVDQHELIMISQPGHVASFANGANLGFINASQKAVHAYRTGGLQNEVRAKNRARFKCYSHVCSRFKAMYNIIDNVPGLTDGETLWYQADKKDGKCKVRAEQKPLPLLREIISRLSAPGDIVVDLFSGTFSTGVACMSIPGERMRRFVGSELDSSCFKVAEWHFENQFARTVLESATNTTVFPSLPDQNVLKAAEHIRLHAEAHRRQIEVPGQWGPPSQLPVMTKLPGHIMEHLSILWRDARIRRGLRTRPYDEWPRDLRGLLHTVETSYLQAVEAKHSRVYINESKIRHEIAGEGLFASETIESGSIVCLYYGILVYTDISGWKREGRAYGTGVGQVSPDEFVRDAMRLPISTSRACDVLQFLPPVEQVRCTGSSSSSVNSSGRHNSRDVYIMPFESCVAQKINDFRYAPGDLDSTSEGPRRIANVIFERKRQCITRIQHLTEHDAIHVRALRKIEKNEELYADYGNEYAFSDVALAAIGLN